MSGSKKEPKRSHAEALALTNSNRGLAIAAVRSMFGHNNPLRPDMEQSAWLALYDASLRYDAIDDASFSSYAYGCVFKRTIINWYAMRCVGHIPRPVAVAFRRIERSKTERSTSDIDGEIVASTSIGDADTQKWDSRSYYAFTRGERSLSELTGNRSDPHRQTLEESIAAEDPSPEELAETSYCKRSVALILAKTSLSEREREVIEARYLRSEEETQSEIGVRLGVTRQRIQQIEAGALSKLRATARRVMPASENASGAKESASA